LLLAVLAAPIFAQPPDAEFFEKNIRPIFASKCLGCHNAKTQTAGISLTSAAGFEKAKSRIVQALSYSGAVKMPPSGKLSDAEVATVKTWVDAGAPWPKETAAKADSKHWAYQPVRDPALPAVKNTTWVQSPIDRFILAKLEEKFEAGSGCLEVDVVTTGLFRSDRPATDAGRHPQFSRRYLEGRVCKSCRPVAGVAAIRRALGPPLARRRALRGLDGHG
jgi:cytochrome c551/c552